MKTPYIIIYLLSLLSISLVRLSAADIDVRVTGIDKASFYCFFNQKGVTKHESLLDSGATTVKNIEPGEYEVIVALSTKLGFSTVKARHVTVRTNEKIEFAVEPGFIRVSLEMQDIAAFSNQELKSGLPVLRFQKQNQPEGTRELYEENLMIPRDKEHHQTAFYTLAPGAYSLFLGTQGGINKKKWIAVKELIITEEDVKTQKVAVKFTGEHVLKLPLPRKGFWPTEER